MADERRIPIEWTVPEGMQIIFANHMLLVEADGQMIATFFQAQPPIVLEGHEAKWDKIESIPAVAVARLAIPPQQIPKIVSVFQGRYEAYLEKLKALAEREEEGG